MWRYSFIQFLCYSFTLVKQHLDQSEVSVCPVIVQSKSSRCNIISDVFVFCMVGEHVLNNSEMGFFLFQLKMIRNHHFVRIELLRSNLDKMRWIFRYLINIPTSLYFNAQSRNIEVKVHLRNPEVPFTPCIVLASENHWLNPGVRY